MGYKLKRNWISKERGGDDRNAQYISLPISGFKIDIWHGSGSIDNDTGIECRCARASQGLRLSRVRHASVCSGEYIVVVVYHVTIVAISHLYLHFKVEGYVPIKELLWTTLNCYQCHLFKLPQIMQIFKMIYNTDIHHIKKYEKYSLSV